LTRKYRKARKAKRGVAERCDRVPPTEETKQKIIPDHTLALFHDGLIDQMHLDAAGEIRTVWEGLSRSLSTKAMSFYYVGNVSNTLDPIMILTEYEAGLYQQTFVPWLNSCNSVFIYPNYFLGRLVIDVAVHNVDPKMIDVFIAKDPDGKTVNHYINGLSHYCRVAGWVRISL
jgi:hypothetical protein